MVSRSISPSLHRPTFGPVVDPARVVTWLVLAVVTMLFAAFASAYLIRMTANDWQPVSLPPILLFNTGVLLLSSLALELGRRHVGLSQRQWTAAAIALGLCFAVGQALSWQQLQSAGIFIPTSPHGTFLYILTALHLLHLIGGGIFLAVSWLRLFSGPQNHPQTLRRLDLSTLYWHFMGGLWIFLYALLHLR